MKRKPEFITFTGADDWTDVAGMEALSAVYPIEWGVLFSPSRQGKDPRYPGGEAQSRLLSTSLRLAAHICGDHARAAMDGRKLDIPVDLGCFRRVQVNHAAPDPWAIERFRRGWGPRCIAQTRGDAFPADASLDWLHDASGGRGIRTTAWPEHPGDGRMVGYAGGISPDNVLDVLAEIAEIAADGPYWIDMESGVRTDDRFDLEKCRRVCELVYGDAGRHALQEDTNHG